MKCVQSVLLSGISRSCAALMLAALPAYARAQSPAATAEPPVAASPVVAPPVVAPPAATPGLAAEGHEEPMASVRYEDHALQFESADGNYAAEIQNRFQFRYAWPFDRDPRSFEDLGEESSSFMVRR